MDRILRLRSPTNYSEEYKKRGINVDKRLLRAHHRTIDQRSNREKSFMCHRGDLSSPPKQARKITEVQLKERVQNVKQPDNSNVLNVRKEKLKKWKEEKLLKEKLKRNGKENKLFKVCKVKYDNPGFLNVQSKSTNDKAQNRTTRASTRINNKKNEVERKQVNQTKSKLSTTKGFRQSARIAAKKLKDDSMVSVMPNSTLHTIPDFSFAPKNFMFSAPGNVSTMQFVPMSPCSIQSFFCPDSKFNSTEVPNRRCSTPLSARHRRRLTQGLDLSVIHTNGRALDVKHAPPVDMPAPILKLTDSISTRTRNFQDESVLKEEPEGCPMSVEVTNTPAEKEHKQNSTRRSNSSDVTSNDVLMAGGYPMSVEVANTPAEKEHKQNSTRGSNSSNITSNDILMEQTSKEKENTCVPSEATQEPSLNQEDKSILPTTREDKDIRMDEAKPGLSVAYFRSLVKSHTGRLQEVCDKWETELQMNSMLGEDVTGDIRTSVGKAQLMIAQRFKQFTGLIENCEFGTGLKETTCTDLQGFWEMVYIQVEDVDEMFKQLDNLKENNWIKAVKNSQQPKVKKIQKKKKVGVAKCNTAAAEAAKQRLAAIKAAMKKKQKIKEEEKIVFEGGFFKVESPIKVSKQPHCQAGTPLRMVMEKSMTASPANVNESRACKRPQVLQQTPVGRTASTYDFRTPRSSKTPTTRTPASRTRSAATKVKDPSLLMKNTPVSGSKFTDKTPIKHQELNNSFSMFLQASMNVVDLNKQAEELMVTDPVQQLNDLVKTPHSVSKTSGKNSYSAKKSSSKKDIKKLDFIKNFESPIQLKSHNHSLESCVPITNDLICFDSPDSGNGGNEEYGLVERLAAISLPNKDVVFSPVRRSARFHHHESDDSNQQPNPVDSILFLPL